MRLLLSFFLLLLIFSAIAEGVGVSQKRSPAPSTAQNPNFGHANAELWKNKGKKREKRYYWYYPRYYGYYGYYGGYYGYYGYGYYGYGYGYGYGYYGWRGYGYYWGKRK